MLRFHPARILSILLAILAISFATPGPGARAGEEAKKKAVKKAEEKPAGDKDLSINKISDSDYASKMLELDVKEGTFQGLSVKASAIPDAYRFLMALGLEEIEKQGVSGQLYLAKLKELNTRCRVQKGKVLILISLSTESDKAYCILNQEPKKHFKIRQKLDVAFAIESLDPKPQYEQFKVFEYPPGTVRGFSRPRLWVLQKATIRLVASNLKAGNQEPIQLFLAGLAVQTKSADPKNSLNLAERQLSVREWSDIAVKDAILTFTPASWDVPKPPPWFEDLLVRLEKS